ncbi:hypothetical protein L1887_47779 [Cichorium endivia]|nr:hypothetical protein L1887_47779 [Cichorium endivia]
MATTRALRVVGVDRAALEGGEGAFDEARLVERVRVDVALHVVLVAHGQACVDDGRRGAPVLVDLESRTAGLDLVLQARQARVVALAREGKVERYAVGGDHHAAQLVLARRARRGARAGGRTRAAADERRDSRGERLLVQVRTDVVHVRIDRSRRHNVLFARNHLGARADHEVRVDTIHDGWIARLADAHDVAGADANVRLDDPPPVDDQRVDHHHIQHRRIAPARRLAHAVADHLAAAELELVAVDRVVLLHLEPQRAVGQPHAVAHRGAIQRRVRLARQFVRRRRRHAAEVRHGLIGEASGLDALGQRRFGIGRGEEFVERAGGEVVAAGEDLGAADLDEGDALGVARFEADGCARCDVETLAQRQQTRERHGGIHLEERIVRSDLDGPVARVGDLDHHPLALGAELDRSSISLRDEGTREHVCGIGRYDGSRCRCRWRRRRLKYARIRSGKEARVERGMNVARLGADGIVHGDQEGSVEEGAFHHDLVQKLGDAGKHVAATKEGLAVLHEFGHRVFAVADALVEHGGDEGGGLGLVEPHAAGEAFLRQGARMVEQELIAFARQQMHRAVACFLVLVGRAG